MNDDVEKTAPNQAEKQRETVKDPERKVAEEQQGTSSIARPFGRRALPLA